MTDIRAADAERVFRSHASLLAYANQKLDVVDGVTDADDVRGSSPRKVQRLRDALYENPGLIRGFVWVNPVELDDENRRMVASWRAFEQSRFLVRRFTPEYAEFLDLASPHRLFAVNALHDSFKKWESIRHRSSQQFYSRLVIGSFLTVIFRPTRLCQIQ